MSEQWAVACCHVRAASSAATALCYLKATAVGLQPQAWSRGLFALRVMYDRSCAFWSLLLRLLRPSMGKNSKAKDGRLQALGDRRLGLYWSAHQRFFRQMLMASKVTASQGEATMPTGALQRL